MLSILKITVTWLFDCLLKSKHTTDDEAKNLPNLPSSASMGFPDKQQCSPV